MRNVQKSGGGVLLVATLISLGCGGATTADLRPQFEAELMAADRAFARETETRGADGWAAWFAEDGLMYQRQGVLVGRPAIHEAMVPALISGTISLRWAPDTAIAAASGDLGYTLGRWQFVSLQEDEVVGTGRYVNIWRRQADSTWKVAVDIGNDDPQPERQ